MRAEARSKLECGPITFSNVMPALVAGIHVFLAGFSRRDVDARDKPMTPNK